ncbi:MAG: hypothetical protein ACLP4V_19385, partial [Methylocella sp.]
LRNLMASAREPVHPFPVLSMALSPAEQLRVTRSFAASFASPPPQHAQAARSGALPIGEATDARPSLPGAKLPVRRWRCAHLMTLEALTLSTAATECALSPAAPRLIARSRKSIE